LEENRVGAYALWDAFTDLIGGEDGKGADLKFLENLAEEMVNMTASSTILKANRVSKEKYIESWTHKKVNTHIMQHLKEKLDGDVREEISLVEKALNSARIDASFLLRLEQEKKIEFTALLGKQESWWRVLLGDTEISPMVGVRLTEAVKDILTRIEQYDEAQAEKETEDAILSKDLINRAYECGCDLKHIANFQLAW
jgi:hypothetical protein